MTWRNVFQLAARPLLVSLLLIAATPPARAQQLPPAIAAAANPITVGQALVKQGKYAEALAKFGEAQGAAGAIPQPALKLFYQITARLGSATALDGMQRYDAAFEHADWANQILATPAAKSIPDTLRAAVHHMGGVILYHQSRTDEAKAFFVEAAKEGDKTAADWQKALTAPAIPSKPADLVAAADQAAQGGKPDQALLLYALALQQYDELGDQTAAVMERALGVALRLDSPAPIPDGATDRIKAADAALANGPPADLQAARDLLNEFVIQVPWWSDGWRKLADVDEKLGDLKAARGSLRYYLKATPKAADQSAIEQRIASLGQRIDAGESSNASALAAAAGSASNATTPPPALPAVTDLSGNWTTVDGRIIAVKQNGNQVSWSSCCKPGHEDLVVNVSGTFDGKNVVGIYHYRENRAEGSGTATYTLTGDRLEGTWKSPDGKTYASVLIRHRGDPPADLGGKWTTVSGHTVTLAQSGNQISWTTCCRQSHPNWAADISAAFDGKNLVGTYHWRDGGQQGNGTVSYTLNGNQLEGTLDRPGKEPYHSVLTRQADSDLSGLWTTQSGAVLTLKQKGNEVTGTYCCRPGHPDWSGDSSGSFDGKNFVGMFRYREGGTQGLGTFIYVLNGGQFEGSFKPAGGNEIKSTLSRMPPPCGSNCSLVAPQPAVSPAPDTLHRAIDSLRVDPINAELFTPDFQRIIAAHRDDDKAVLAGYGAITGIDYTGAEGDRTVYNVVFERATATFKMRIQSDGRISGLAWQKS